LGSSFSSRLQALGGDKQGNVEVAPPASGYEHMLAGNQMIRGITRAIVGAEPFGYYPVKYARRPTGGQLRKDAGINDTTAPRRRP
jgi:hypothetical protein